MTVEAGTPPAPMLVAGRPLAEPSPVVEVRLSKGRRLRCRVEGVRWQVTLQRHRQGEKGAGRWFTGDAVVLSLAVKVASGGFLTDAEQAEIVRYLGGEFYRLAGLKGAG